jgi:hypothetical protein
MTILPRDFRLANKSKQAGVVISFLARKGTQRILQRRISGKSDG